MKHKHEQEQEAAGRIALGVMRILERYPLYGALVASLRLVRDRTVPTMAVGMGKTQMELYYNPEFVCKISLPELSGVLHHEIRHILYEHVFADPADFTDEHARIIAEEVTVNEMLPEPLPGEPLTLTQYPQLSADETTLQRYARLKKKNRSRAKDKGAHNTSSTPSAADDANNSTPGATDAERPATLDDHSRWNTLRDNENQAKAQIAAAVSAALRSGQELSEEEQELQQSLMQTFGLSAGGMVTPLDPLAVPETVNWRQVLRQFVARVLKPAYDFTVPSRRMPQLLGIVPGKQRRAGRCRILAGVDTSGSMSAAMLGAIARELTFLAKRAEITIVEFDAAIQRVYRYRGEIKDVQGRGGTNFIPLLDPQFLDLKRPDLVCVFTDGDGAAPEEPPRYPVLWVLVEGGQPPVEWGTVTHMEHDGR